MREVMQIGRNAGPIAQICCNELSKLLGPGVNRREPPHVQPAFRSQDGFFKAVGFWWSLMAGSALPFQSESVQ